MSHDSKNLVAKCVGLSDPSPYFVGLDQRNRSRWTGRLSKALHVSSVDEVIAAFPARGNNGVNQGLVRELFASGQWRLVRVKRQGTK